MSSPATGSFYSVVTFIALGAGFAFAMRAAFGWEWGPSDHRTQTSVMVLFYCAAGWFSMKVGRHREVAYLEAVRRGAIDVGRALKGLVMR